MAKTTSEEHPAVPGAVCSGVLCVDRDVARPPEAKKDLMPKYLAKTDPQGLQDCPEMGTMLESMDNSIGMLLDWLDHPENKTIKETEKVAKYIESVLDTIPEIKQYASNVGNGNPKIHFNLFPKDNAKNYTEFFVELKEYDLEDFEEFRKVKEYYGFN